MSFFQMKQYSIITPTHDITYKLHMIRPIFISICVKLNYVASISESFSFDQLSKEWIILKLIGLFGA